MDSPGLLNCAGMQIGCQVMRDSTIILIYLTFFKSKCLNLIRELRS